MNKYCIFPDQTKIKLQAILDTTETESLICYFDEDKPQVLWVPNDFISNE